MRRVGSIEGGRVPGTAGGGKVPALHHHLGPQPPAVPAGDEHCCPAPPPSPGAVHAGGRTRHPDRPNEHQPQGHPQERWSQRGTDHNNQLPRGPGSQLHAPDHS